VKQTAPTRGFFATFAARPPALRAEDLSQKDRRRFREPVASQGQAPPSKIGEDPSSIGDHRQHSIDQVGLRPRGGRRCPVSTQTTDSFENAHRRFKP
jgi:hypothetical protein